LDDYVVAGRDLTDAVHHVPRGGPGGRQRRRLGQRNLVRDPQHRVRRRRDQLGEPTGHIAADDPRLRAVATLAGAAARTRPAAHGGVDDHSCTFGDARRAAAGRRDRAGDVHSGDVRQREAGDDGRPLALDHVEPVEGTGAHSDEHLARTRFRLRDDLQPHDLGAAEVGLHHGSHRCPIPSSEFDRHLAL
jgi:hypothetical protein